MAETKLRLGYIGMGLMGAPMAGRLLDAGYEVTVWNRTADKMTPLIEKGARAAGGPAQVAEAADIVMMCLTAAPAVEAVAFGDSGLAEADGQGKVLVDFSSMRPDLTRSFSAQLEERNGMAWIDAPVSGGVPGAEQGTLIVMAGGEAKAFERAAPVVAHLSDRFTLMGESGAGQMTKLCNQIVALGTMALVAEMVAFARKTGVDATRLSSALAGAWADSKPFQIFAPRMATDTLEPKMGDVSLMAKDLDTVWDVAREAGVPVPMTATALSLGRQMLAQGHGDKDISVLVKLFLGEPI